MDQKTAFRIALALYEEFNVLEDTDEVYMEDECFADEDEITAIVLKAANRPRRGIKKVKPSK